MKERLESKKGFTLAELLIVVAIIAVLVAVAIPVFTAQLNKSRYATDVANARSIYAELNADYLANGGAAQNDNVVSSKSISTAGDITVTLGGSSNKYHFNGVSTVEIHLGTDNDPPYVTVEPSSDSYGNSETFGTAPSTP